MGSYVYKFYNYDNDIIYIGKTNNIEQRMKQHFGPYPHLDKSCYEQVYRIIYSNVLTKYNSEMLETYLINKYHPIYNRDKKYFKRNKDIDFKIPELKWYELSFLRLVSPQGIPGIELFPTLPPYINHSLLPGECIEIAFKFNVCKISHYNYEFTKFAPDLLKIPNFREELYSLLEYVKTNINPNESNLDEHLTVDSYSQIEENYLAFNLGNILNLAYKVPHFNLFLKLGIVENLDKDIFCFKFITPNLLKSANSIVKNFNIKQ